MQNTIAEELNEGTLDAKYSLAKKLYKMAKLGTASECRIVWNPLKPMTRSCWATKPNKTDLRIELITGGTLRLHGADTYDSLRGDGLNFVILDEFASLVSKAWTEVLRPVLARGEPPTVSPQPSCGR